MPHLLDWAKIAIHKWPYFAPWVSNRDFEKAFTNKMIQVIEHYERGWDIFTRP